MGDGMFGDGLFCIAGIDDCYPALSPVILVLHLVFGLQNHGPTRRHRSVVEVQICGFECISAEDGRDVVNLPARSLSVLVESLDLRGTLVARTRGLERG